MSQGVSVDVIGYGLQNDILAVFIIGVKQAGFQPWHVYRDYEAFQTLEFQVIHSTLLDEELTRR